MTAPLRLRAAAAIRARRHPLAVGFAWLYEVALGLAIAHPWYAAIRGVYGGHPDGDRPLFSADGLELAELFMKSDGAIRALVAGSAWTIAIAVILGQVRLGALVSALALERRDELPLTGRDAIAQGVGRLFPLAGLQIVSALAQGSLLALGVGLAGKLHGSLAERGVDARADVGALAAFAPFVLLALAASVVVDVARVGVVVSPGTARAGVVLGLRAFVRRPLPALGGWAARAAAGAALVALGAVIADRLGGRPGAAGVALFAAHQLVVALRVALRASWLAHAARLVAARAEADEPAPTEPEGSTSSDRASGVGDAEPEPEPEAPEAAVHSRE